MTEKGGADRPGDEADGVDCEHLQRAGQRIGGREIQFRKDERCHQHVKQEIIGLDHGANRAGYDGAPQLRAVLGIGQARSGHFA